MVKSPSSPAQLRQDRGRSHRAAAPAAANLPAPSHFLTSTFGLGLVGSLLLYISFPPVDLWPLAWAAPIAWVYLIRRREWCGRRPYRQLWLAGSCFWLGVLYWLCLPYPPASWIGWLALSCYLGVYLPVFVALS